MAKYNVIEEIVIDKPLEVVLNYLVDFKNWSEWSPWICIEKDAKVEISSPSNKEGASYQWNGKLMGSGRIDLLKVSEQRIDYELTYFSPFKTKSKVWFEFSKVGSGCQVVWGLEGRLPFFMFFMKKIMSAMLGMDYRRGLLMLKDALEKGSVASSLEIKGMGYYGFKNLVGLKSSCKLSDIGTDMDKAFKDLMNYVADQQLKVVGPVLAVHTKFDMVSQACEYFVCVQLDNVKNVDESKLEILDYNFDDFVAVKHIGEYKFLGNAWAAANSFMRYKKYKPLKGVVGIEVYNNMKGEVEDRYLDTDVVIPLI